MALPTIVTRTGKGSALSFAEADANFENLRDAVITVGDGTNTTDITLNGAITFTAGTGISITESNGVITVDNTVADTTNFNISDGTNSGTISDGQTVNLVDDGVISLTYNNSTQTISASFSNPGYITELNDDGSPQLGGTLDTNGNSIINSGGGTLGVTSAGGFNVSCSGGQISFNATSGVLLQQGDLDVNGGTIIDATLEDFRETVYDLSTTSGDLSSSIAAENGSIQRVTLTGDITIDSFAGATAGQSITLIINQGTTGGYTLSSSTLLFSNSGDSTLSTTSNAIDILTIFYDGTTYYASLGKDFA